MSHLATAVLLEINSSRGAILINTVTQVLPSDRKLTGNVTKCL